MKDLETKRLYLRAFKLDDLDDFYEYAKVKGVGEMAGWPAHKNKKESLSVLKAFIENGDVFAIVLKDSLKVIGSIGFHKKPFDEDDHKYKQLEIGYVLSKAYWNQGLMSEAARRVIRYCFEDLGCDRLTCAHFVFNKASKRIIEKMGFTYVREGIYHSKALDRKFDEKKYVLTRAQWEKQKEVFT